MIIKIDSFFPPMNDMMIDYTGLLWYDNPFGRSESGGKIMPFLSADHIHHWIYHIMLHLIC